jgi:hypothetical protein
VKEKPPLATNLKNPVEKTEKPMLTTTEDQDRYIGHNEKLINTSKFNKLPETRNS